MNIKLVFPTFLEDMLGAGGMDDSDREDHFSSGSSSSSISTNPRSMTPLSESSNEASYTASVHTDQDDD